MWHKARNYKLKQKISEINTKGIDVEDSKKQIINILENEDTDDTNISTEEEIYEI